MRAPIKACSRELGRIVVRLTDERYCTVHTFLREVAFLEKNRRNNVQYTSERWERVMQHYNDERGETVRKREMMRQKTFGPALCRSGVAVKHC